jgi:hypothetical protein
MKGQVTFQNNEFVKATFCEEDGDQCVTVARRHGMVGVRDSKDPQNTTLCFSRDEWRAFVAGVKAGEFDI